MEWMIVTIESGANPAPLADVLNEGWNIHRVDATKDVLVYILFKHKPLLPFSGGAVGSTTLSNKQ